ncbi:MAG: hypothetical protein U0797_20630 [Gemmataceae bacterium]
MHRAYLLTVTALGEVGTGVALLVLPSVPVALLLGMSAVAPEALFIGRVTGAALLALGVASWLARADEPCSSQAGLLTGLLIYDGTAAALLGYAGLVLGLAGVALWPAAALHAALAVWCALSLWGKPYPPRPPEGNGGRPVRPPL